MKQHLLIRQTEVAIETEEARLAGTLNLPTNPIGIVVFAHGSGSSRLSPRNRFVAGVLNNANLATLLFDLLTPGEQQADEQSGHLRFDIGLLARRLIGVVDWLGQSKAVLGLSIGLFGASTGAAATLVAAAERPDLAGEALRAVKAPTLLIVGGKDAVVIDLNREASRSLSAPCRLEIVTEASHLFQEPGTLEEVARLARDWFQQHLPKPTERL